jgi:broad specificity phosphatase PhoE
LTELGRLQAAALGSALAEGAQATCRILTSPLQRAEQTAQAIAAAFDARPGLGDSGRRPSVSPDERFIELDYGELDGSPVSDVPAGLWDNWRSNSHWCPPGGESLAGVMTRVGAACEEIAAEAARRDVVIVCHVSPIKAAVSWALGAGPEVSWRLSLGVASITRIATGQARGPVLVSFNETGHLAGVKAGEPVPNATIPRARRPKGQ